MAALNGKELDGRPIRVDLADSGPRAPREPREFQNSRPERSDRAAAPRGPPRFQRADDTGRRLYIGNLDYGTSDGKIISTYFPPCFSPQLSPLPPPTTTTTAISIPLPRHVRAMTHMYCSPLPSTPKKGKNMNGKNMNRCCERRGSSEEI